MVRARVVLEAGGLILVLAFVASVAYLPHADTFNHPPDAGPHAQRLGQAYWSWLVDRSADDYRYTVHVDENVHWVAMGNLQRAEGVRHGGLFFSLGEDAPSLSLGGLVHERGFHVAVVAFETLTGVPWLELFRFLPTVMLGLTAALVWAATRPWPGALAAAALVAFIPTTARFLGPGFLVPIGFSLAWVAATLVILPRVAAGGRGAALLVLLLAWSFFLHLIAGAAVLLLALCALPFARGNRRGMATLAAVGLVPAVLLGPVFLEDLRPEVELTSFLPDDLTVFDQLGPPLLFLWVLGCALTALHPPQGHARLVVGTAALASIVVLGLILLNLTAHLRAYALYDRWHQVFALLLALPAAHALVVLGEAAAWAAQVAHRRWRSGRALPTGFAAAVAVLVAGGGFLAATDTGLGYHLGEPYYHVLDDRDWNAFTWAAANVNGTYEVFLTHPWKAPVLSALTGQEPYAFLSPGYPPIRGDEYERYVREAWREPLWLVERDISHVADPTLPASPHFEHPGPDNALLAWRYAQELAAVRAAGR